MTKKASRKIGSIKRHIRGVVDELVSNSLNAGARAVSVGINNQPEYFEIIIEDDGSGMNPRLTKEVENLLRQPRREELEEYYGDLAGVSGFGSGLTIVGLLVDEAEVQSTLGRGTKIRVRRWHDLQ